jgi:hypothetical protein
MKPVPMFGWKMTCHINAVRTVHHLAIRKQTAKMHKFLWLNFILSSDALHVSDYIRPSSGATFISCTSHIPVYARTCGCYHMTEVGEPNSQWDSQWKLVFTIRKVLWMTSSTKDFLCLPRSYSKCWFGTQNLPFTACLSCSLSPKLTSKFSPKRSSCNAIQFFYFYGVALQIKSQTRCSTSFCAAYSNSPLPKCHLLHSPYSPDSTNIPMRYTFYEMMLLMMDWW